MVLEGLHAAYHVCPVSLDEAVHVLYPLLHPVDALLCLFDTLERRVSILLVGLVRLLQVAILPLDHLHGDAVEVSVPMHETILAFLFPLHLPGKQGIV